MTDITELAQREKFEAWVMTKICISKSTLEGLRIADGYRNRTLSGRDYNLMWNCWKEAGAELVEALEGRNALVALQKIEIRELNAELEKAQRANAAQDDHINQQQDRIDQLEKKNAEIGKHVGMLESRTVTVKLPPHAPENLACCLDGYETWLIATTFRDTWNKCLDEVMRTGGAGIKWEAE
ncbi:TPA: hypothetical protein ACTV60_003168 [Klebsiella pneumoniae]|uniref:hypothetical protein n=1 Tax=Klebsiella variicola TaxID=244366 RepID=UPI0035B1C9E8|nr:hypothetical protein [Klebsiella pneumoniae]HCA9798133.1 hypothetical protein [Klebsiella variicola subsp. variicola]